MEQAIFIPLFQVLEVAHMQRRIGQQACRSAAKAVVLRGVQGVVPSREALKLYPCHPGCSKRAALARGFELLRGCFYFWPCFGRLVGIQASFLEGIFVVIENSG